MKSGWIDNIEEDYFECRLSEEGDLDYTLTVPNISITTDQMKEVKLGRVVRYDIKTDTLEFPTFPPLTEEQIQNAMDRADEMCKYFKWKDEK